MTRRRERVLAGVTGVRGLFAAIVAGCAAGPDTNPALSVTHAEARAALAAMSRDPVPLQRPLVVLAGYRAWHLSVAETAAKLARATSGQRRDVLPVSYMLRSDLDTIASLVVRKVEERWPSADPAQTREVDVVAVSMGGLVARWAALPAPHRVLDGRRAGRPPADFKMLRVARLFTLATPHRGARAAAALRPDAAARDMSAGSALLARLDEHLEHAPYELVCYARCHDHIVGARRAAPPGRAPIWHDRTRVLSHITIGHDTLFLADISRRLRGEEPLVRPTDPPPRD